jgi:hypothetical protein
MDDLTSLQFTQQLIQIICRLFTQAPHIDIKQKIKHFAHRMYDSSLKCFSNYLQSFCCLHLLFLNSNAPIEFYISWFHGHDQMKPCGKNLLGPILKLNDFICAIQWWKLEQLSVNLGIWLVNFHHCSQMVHPLKFT